MTHEDAGHYSMKHPEKKLDRIIASHIEKFEENGRIACSYVHAVSKQLGIPPKEVGVQVDLMELRINECVLGLFGYEPNGKGFNLNTNISPELKEAIEKIAPDGRTTCIACWDIAHRLKMKRLDVGSACEKLGVKIKQCQIGAF
ncbi:MAG: hypothetical protein HQK65_18835 [Desulfamplus sp.]|nr:hypothetical protein [Desulfamplus sp.]